MMTEKKAQHERRQKMHEDDLQQIQEYEEYFAQLAIEEAERAEQERIAAEARAEEERAQKVIHDAAAKIQALYRGFRERQELANPKGKGKGKGVPKFFPLRACCNSLARPLRQEEEVGGSSQEVTGGSARRKKRRRRYTQCTM